MGGWYAKHLLDKLELEQQLEDAQKEIRTAAATLEVRRLVGLPVFSTRDPSLEVLAVQLCGSTCPCCPRQPVISKVNSVHQTELGYQLLKEGH